MKHYQLIIIFPVPNPYFQFKQFTIHHDRCAMKVTTDSCFFGAWTANEMQNEKLNTRNVLDIGCGTGLLSLMIAQKNPVNIDAVEIDPEAAEQANQNAASSPWPGRIDIFNEDILTFEPAKKYDAVICNPPFYENELASGRDKKNMAHHSSRLTIAQVLDQIKSHLHDDGCFFLMYPFKREKEMKELFSQKQLYPAKKLYLRQSIQHAPFRTIVMGRQKNFSEATEESIAVWNEHQQYTERFRELMKDYYLYL